MTTTIWLWVVFNVFVLGMLALDLGVVHRKARAVTLSEAAIWSGVWIGLALLFNLGIYLVAGGEKALEFLVGYLIEKSLSVDNIFVFLMIFGYFAVPEEFQHRVLFWGILGALVMRAIFIAAGLVLLEYVHWIIYVFGGFLVYTGLRMLRQREAEVHPERNPVLRAVSRYLPMTKDYVGHRFTVVRDGRRMATPLLVVLIVVESTDLVFAADSIPAILAVTRDPFIVYTSNVFAILGLRALYFLLAGVMDMFYYLGHGLGLVLVFVGAKMLTSDLIKIPITTSLGVIAAILGTAVVASLLRRRRRMGGRSSAG